MSTRANARIVSFDAKLDRFIDTFVKRDGRWLAAATVSVKQQ